MKVFRIILYFFTVIVLVSTFFAGCGSSAMDNENVNYQDSDRSIVVHHDTLRSNLNFYWAVFDCFIRCEDCKKVPCTPECDILCQRFDRSIVTASDIYMQALPEDERVERILALTQRAVDLKKMFDYKVILSKNNSLKFYLMKAELDNLINRLDIMYKAALLNVKSHKQDSTNQYR